MIRICLLIGTLLTGCGSGAGNGTGDTQKSGPSSDGSASAPSGEATARSSNDDVENENRDEAQSAKSDSSEALKPGVQPAAEPSPSRVIRFPWNPDEKNETLAAVYEMPDPLDQHRIVIPPGAKPDTPYPVVLAFHGQPKRGKNPRDYVFMEPVQTQITQMIADGEIKPVILVMPVFRYVGFNWVALDPGVFRKHVEALLAKEGIKTGNWYAFGHSGAAGCGGHGLNIIHRANPSAVGFFDTCLGKGWQNANKKLLKRKIATVNIFSVETAGFKPRQRPEYQSTFNFGKAFSPLGIEPVKCPEVVPHTLRTLEHRCSAHSDGPVRAFVIDTGEGQQAHQDILEPAIRYFLMETCGLKK